jgi:hypothetical protein
VTVNELVTLYYLPGYGGGLKTGLGAGLEKRGFHVIGRETKGDFRSLVFTDQVQTVANDIQTHFWHQDARVICNSFGAYLFLHAQTLMPPFIGRVLLLSPIVGEFSNEVTRTGFSPPHPTKLFEIAKSGEFPSPNRCEIHVGSEDWQSMPEVVQEFGSLINIPVHVVAGRGHDLGKQQVDLILDKWMQV